MCIIYSFLYALFPLRAKAKRRGGETCDFLVIGHRTNINVTFNTNWLYAVSFTCSFIRSFNLTIFQNVVICLYKETLQCCILYQLIPWCWRTGYDIVHLNRFQVISYSICFSIYRWQLWIQTTWWIVWQLGVHVIEAGPSSVLFYSI